jgi:glutamate-ammonia-ligase adenylyltransferase
MLQLKHGPRAPGLRQPNTLSALSALHAAGHLDRNDLVFFSSRYRLLRTIEGRLQLMSSTARDVLPADPTELAKLTHLLQYASDETLLADFERATREIRQRFEAAFDAESA